MLLEHSSPGRTLIKKRKNNKKTKKKKKKKKKQKKREAQVQRYLTHQKTLIPLGPPPRPWAQAYGRVLGGGVFL